MHMTYEADVALIHIAGGSSRTTPPPGSVAQSAPRRAARGRYNDLLFLNLTLLPDRSAAPGLTTHLAHLAAQAFYQTPGSVTAGLRESLTTINDRLMDANQIETSDNKLYGQVNIGVLHGGDFYIAQCGIGHSVLIRPGVLSLHTSEVASNRPLGVSSIPHIRYHHIKVQPGDLVILTTAEAPVWTDFTLEKLTGLNPVQIIERLTLDITREITGMVVGIAASGTSIESPVSKPTTPEIREGTPTFRRELPESEQLIEVPQIARKPAKTRLFIRRQRIRIRRFFSWLGYSGAKILARLTPGLSEPPPGSYSPKILAATAIIVPLIVVFIASIVYFQRGRAQQYHLNIADARAAIAAAEGKESEQEARVDWLTARFWLDTASKYGTSEEFDFLNEKVNNTLDTLDRISRLSFQAVVSGGFGPDAEISALAATGTELYVLDTTNAVLWHLWATGQGYDIDGDFRCLDAVTGIGSPVDLAIEPAPSALNAESIIAIDEVGNIVYCAPDKEPATSRLTMPDIGWGKISAFDIYNNSLYVMDTDLDAVWVFDSTSGLVSGKPTLYFVDQVPDLEEAIDISASQNGLLILYADGRVDQCNRVANSDSGVGEQLGSVCIQLKGFDEREGIGESDQIPNAQPVELLYSPPPDPSFYFLDVKSGGVFRYSLNMIYQGQYHPVVPFDEKLTSMTFGPPNVIFVATGNQVYHAFLNR